MNQKELEPFAKEAAKGIKTPQDLNEFSKMLKKSPLKPRSTQRWTSIWAMTNINLQSRLINAMAKLASV